MISTDAKTSGATTPLHAYLRGLVLRWFLPLASLAGAAVAIAIVELQEIRLAQVQMKARNLASEVDRGLAMRLEGLRALAALTASSKKSVSLEDWYRSLKTYDQKFGMPVMVVDTQRKILRHSRRPPGAVLPELPQPRGRPAFQQAVDSGQAQIGDPLQGPILGTTVVQVIVPVLQHGEVLLGLMPTEMLRPLLLNETLPQGWRASLLDSFDREIVSTQPAQSEGFAQGDRRAQAIGSSAQPSEQALRILLVDDHAMVRDGLRQLIMSQPHLAVVGEAIDGVDAIAKARALSPDVVVIDRSMPVLDGIKATRKILAMCPTTLVFGMSMDEGDVSRQFEKAGATGFFSKKDGAELLLQRLAIERNIKLRGESGGADSAKKTAVRPNRTLRIAHRSMSRCASQPRRV